MNTTVRCAELNTTYKGMDVIPEKIANGPGR